MNSFLYSIFGFIVAIGVLVAVHEFGHFWVARKLGVKVLRFSIGFGKAIWSRHGKTDNTEYVIAAIPLGGYVKMLDENDGEVTEEEKPRAFNRQPLSTRIAVVVAGPAFNFLFAIVAYTIVSMVGSEDIKPVVGSVQEGSPAAHAGLKPGDEIVAVNGRLNRGWSEQRLYILNKAFQGESVSLTVTDITGIAREAVLELDRLTPQQLNPGIIETGLGMAVQRPIIPADVGKVIEGSPSDEAGLEDGDKFLSIDGQQVDSWNDVVAMISTKPGQALTVVVERVGAEFTLSITPDPVEVNGQTIGRVGIQRNSVDIPDDWLVTIRDNPFTALVNGTEKTWIMSSLTVRMLINMLRLQISAENLSGPITIAQYAGQTAQIGFTQFLLFLAVISISLGILNLLPIPVLDGGHLLYYLIESIKGSPLSEKGLLVGQQIGIAILIGLMSLAFYNDIVRLLS